MLTGQHPWNINNNFLMLKQITTGTFPIPDFVSPDAADLIKNLIVVIPELRFTPEQVLAHPWMERVLSKHKMQNSILPPLIRRSASFDITKYNFFDDSDLIPPSIAIPHLTSIKYRKVEPSKSRRIIIKSQSNSPLSENQL